MRRAGTAKQLNEKRKAKKRARERARIKARKGKTVNGVPQVPIRLHDTGGNTVMMMPNNGLGRCALLTLITLRDLRDGIPYDAVFASVNGELTAEMEGRVQQLREDIVAAADGHEKCDSLLGDGSREPREFVDVAYDTKYDIETMEMFKEVTLCADGYIDWRAVMIRAELLRLDGFRIVESNKEGKLLSVLGRHESTEGIPMARYYHWGHYEAVVVPPVSLLQGNMVQIKT